jgi:hypothetical protein
LIRLVTSFLARVVFVAATMSAAATFAGGCSDGQPKCPPAPSCADRDRDDGGPAHDDVCSAGTSEGSCHDVDCSCFIADGEGTPIATVSLDCLCDRPNACPDYATARANCQPSETVLFTYPSCDLEIIRFRYDLYSPGSSYVYDATTHALVGGSYGSDAPIGACGGKTIFGRRAGTFPPPDCKFAEMKYVCRADASN